jgi:uncharacterized membrane protein
MFKTSRTSEASTFAASLAKDKKFRKELLSAINHATIARRRAKKKMGLMGVARGMSRDPKLRRELDKMMNSLDKAWSRLEKKRSHKVRNTLIVLGGVGGVAAVVLKTKAHEKMPIGARSARTLEASKEVGVPVSVAYNQWTQFEDFPLFMEGVDHVEQRSDTQLHWVATVGGHTAEWDAKIVEQHPDSQISWISEDGRKTRGTVSFEPAGDNRTLIRLSMSYQADSPLEQAGSAAGLDSKRVRGDLGRFKVLIEGRGEESGAWRGEVSAGRTEG